MHFFVSLVVGSIILFFLARAIIEIIVGICQVFLVFCLLAIAYALEAIAWGIRTYQNHRRMI